MIIKLHQEVEGLNRYFRSHRHVMAKRMTEDFMVETDRVDGWQQGRRGDWLVLLEGSVWVIYSDNQFTRIYSNTDAQFIAQRRNGHA